MCVDGAGAEESAVFGLYGCWPDLFKAVYHLYDMTDDSWEPTGKFDACNVTKPFAKVVNSWYLIHYCLSDDYSKQWHSTEDYTSLGRAADNRFHGPFYVRFTAYDGARPADSELRRFAARDRTNLHCPLFDLGANLDSPAVRAAGILHEAWHHWQLKHSFDPAHQSCPGDCDWYYFHPISRYEFGWLDRYDTNPADFGFHSPYQIMIEFLADLSECSRPKVPAVTRAMARSGGNQIISQKFKNTVSYRIGDPRPW
jgi:hypothetical protein